jgi:hypothetical protein
MNDLMRWTGSNYLHESLSGINEFGSLVHFKVFLTDCTDYIISERIIIEQKKMKLGIDHPIE